MGFGFIEVFNRSVEPPFLIDVALFEPQDSEGFNQIPKLVLGPVVLFDLPVCELGAINNDLKRLMLFDLSYDLPGNFDPPIY